MSEAEVMYASVFGKLPIYPDFIRFNATGEEVQAIDRWIQEGMFYGKTRRGPDWEGAFSKAGGWNFVFSPETATHFLVGVLVPSRDRAGRLYPFLTYLRIAKPEFPLPQPYAAVACSDFLRRAKDLALTGWQDKDLKSFGRELESLRPDRPNFAFYHDEYIKYKTSVYLEGFESRLYAGGIDFSRNRADAALLEILRPLKSKPGSLFNLGLQFPLDPEGQPGYDILFWFDWIGRIWARKSGPVAMFWDRGFSGSAPSLLVFFAMPSPKQFHALIRPEDEDDTWYSFVSRSASRQDRVENVDPKRRELLNRSHLTLAEFLDTVEALEQA